MSKMSEPLNKAWLLALVAASLTACGGGGGGGSPSPSPPPAPAPPPAPPPPSSPGAPPLSSTVTDLTTPSRIGAVHWSNGNTANGGQGSAVDGIECLPNMPDDYHVHAYLGIYLNGDLLAVPQSVGMVASPRCFYALHTHDASGQVHVEATAAGTYTLGQLFNIWGQPLEATNVAGLTGNPVEVFVVENGTVTKVDSNWGAIELTSKKMIHIVVGTHPSELRNITWTGT